MRGRGMFLTRDVEGQGIGQTRSAGRRQAGSVIWRMIPVERASVKHTPRSHLTHLDVGGDARGRSLTLTLTLRTVVQNVRLGLDHDRDQQHVFVFSVWHAASPGSLAPLDFRLHAFVDRSISCLVGKGSLFGQCRRATISWRFRYDSRFFGFPSSTFHFTCSLPSKRDRRARNGSFDLLTTHALRSDVDCEAAVKIVQPANKPLSINGKYQQEDQARILTFAF